MSLQRLFNTDPLTASWLIVIALLLLVVVVLPIVRFTLASLMYAAAAITGRDHLRNTAARTMPRIAHLIGGIVIGTAAVAAPAMALGDGSASLTSIDLDRDAGASSTLTSPTPSPATVGHGHTSEARTPAKTSSPAVTPSLQQTGDGLYVVHTGDSLWAIAAAQLEDPTDAEITDAWKAIWRANRAVIGDDPGLIFPGQHLDIGMVQ